MDEYYAKYASNNAANGASDTDFESPEPDTTSSNNVVKFLEEQQASKILKLDRFFLRSWYLVFSAISSNIVFLLKQKEILFFFWKFFPPKLFFK